MEYSLGTLKEGFFGFFLFMYDIQHCFPTVSEPEHAGIEPRTVATTALAVRRSNHSARSLWSYLRDVNSEDKGETVAVVNAPREDAVCQAPVRKRRPSVAHP
jgi:hypothetical protein